MLDGRHDLLGAIRKDDFGICADATIGKVIHCLVDGAGCSCGIHLGNLISTGAAGNVRNGSHVGDHRPRLGPTHA